MTDVYYTPRDIIFSREQMLWLIKWLPYLEDENSWPPDPQETGYTDAPRVQRSRNYRAPFETPAGFVAEVRCRLKTTGDTGEVLIHEVQHGLESYELLSRPAQRALNYISGWKRRRQAFSQWEAEQHHRIRNHKKYGFSGHILDKQE